MIQDAVISVRAENEMHLEPALLFSLLLHALLVFFLVFTTDFHTRNIIVPEKGDSPEEIVHASFVPVLPTNPTVIPAKQMQKQMLLKELARETMEQKKIQQNMQQQKKRRKQIQQASARQFAHHMKTLNALSLQAQMKEQIKQGNNRLDHLRDKKRQGMVDLYRGKILQVISQHWLLPGQFDRKLFADLLIRLDASGTVQTVEIMKSSGNTALDNSARMAVIRSSPLPVPSDPQIFASFRQFVLRVRPENILSGV